MASRENTEPVSFLRWALPGMGYRWDAFRKPRRQLLRKIRNRMDQLGIDEFSEYREHLKHHQEEWVVLERLCDVTISKFYRNRTMWEYLRDQILPELVERRAPGPVRFWSAGCCNGEEPFSIAMIISEVFEKMKSGMIAAPDKQEKESEAQQGMTWPPCPVSLLATDRNEEVLARAKRGFFPVPALRELTAREIREYFQPAYFEENEDYRIRADLLQMVEFEERDINGRLPAGLFDMVFCRNLVFTYFSKERQEEFLERLIPRIAPEGYLVLGANESLPDQQMFDIVNQSFSVYRMREPADR